MTKEVKRAEGEMSGLRMKIGEIEGTYSFRLN